MAPERRFDFRGLVYAAPDSDDYVAHCLELDLVEYGASVEEALTNLVEVVAAHLNYALEHSLENALFNPAPKKYWDAYYAYSMLDAVDRSRRDELEHRIQDLIGSSAV